MQSFGFGLLVVESSRDANGGGRRVREFKAHGHKFGTGVADVVMVMIVFHRFIRDKGPMALQPPRGGCKAVGAD